jgi:alkylation response protein AidB-like acyl-CoA dehydrogenase
MADAMESEPVEDFGRRARDWLRTNMPRLTVAEVEARSKTRSDEEELERVARCRQLQRMLYEGGLAGVCVPREYGGQGLTPAHQEAFNAEIVGYDYPAEIQTPTFTPCLALIVDLGTEEQKRRHIPPILRGETLWMQLLSEPQAGSDVASARTTAARDGDEWVLNGSKIWTTGAWWADWGICLARTDWDAPKHQGLTVFMLPLTQPGIEVRRIEMVNGSREFCQEFLTDVRVPDSERLGGVGEGWSVGTRWMYHERTTSAGSPYATRAAGLIRTRYAPAGGAAGLASRSAEVTHIEGAARQALIGEARCLELVGASLSRRIARKIETRAINDQAAAITRLFAGTANSRLINIGYELAGPAAAAWSDAATEPPGVAFLLRQAMSIGGGTTEMARNVISERVLEMPREPSADRGLPYRDVRSGR